MYAVPNASYDAYIQKTSRQPPQEPSKRVIRGTAGLEGRIKQLQTINCTVLLMSTTQRIGNASVCLLYTSPSPRDRQKSRMPSSA